MLALSQAWALPSQSLESIEYLSHQGAAAIELSFADPVNYLSNFPLESGATVQVFIGPRAVVDAKVDKLPYTQAMRAPHSSEVPLTQVSFRVDESGDTSVILDFEQLVRFEVSAGRHANTLLISLPEITIEQPEQVKDPGAKKPSKASRLLALGRKALKQGKNKRAIRIFTKMMGLPESEERREAVELLGVARERNGQKAHAKTMYREYLKQYPESDGASRVKQRLQDLLHAQLKPRKQLKAKKLKDDKTTSRLYGSFSQYYYRGENKIQGADSDVDQSMLMNYLSLNWRVRNTDYDVKNYINVSQYYDYASETGKALALQTAYSQFKHNAWGFSGRLGRQASSGGGVLGKFDGLRASYDVTNKVAVNAVMGYPVNYSDKRSLQSEKPFYGISAELDGEGKDIDILPYYIRQDVDGIVDREAIGSEFRFFHPLGNFYAQIDYDIHYSDLNMYLFRGQYNWRKKTIFNLNLDVRNSPLLFTSNALIGRTDVSSIEALLTIRSEDRIYELAENRVGISKTMSFGVSHTLNSQYQLNGDVMVAQYEYMVDDLTPGVINIEKEQQVFLSGQLIANKWINERDVSVLGVRLSQTGAYKALSLSGSNRLPLKNKWQFYTRLFVDYRQGDSGEDLSRYRPSVKWSFQQNQKMFYEAELGLEWWQYSGETNNPDVQRHFVNLGYRWNF